MGWKRVEKEFKKTGKSVENEAKRLLKRITEKQSDSGTFASENQACAACTSASITQVVPEVHVPISEEDANVNPYGLKPGRAYIINHLNFNNTKLRKRVGSEIDVRRLQEIFRKFHMKVKLVSDATVAEVRAAMEKISLYDFQKLSCLVIVIMSHGHEGNRVSAKDGVYSLDYDILYPVLRNSSLRSKLKLLITQACKGPISPLHLDIEGPRSRPTTIPSEILQLNSCVEGYVSYIDSRNGSTFISRVCDNLEKSGTKSDILTIANKVVADVKTDLQDIQIPMIHSTLTKPFVFGHYVVGAAESQASSSSDEEVTIPGSQTEEFQLKDVNKFMDE